MRALAVLAGLAAAMLAPAAFAQGAYPSKPIHIVVGFPAGAGNDIIARLVSQKMSERFGQPVVVENKPGASAIIAAEYVKKAPADGYTLMVAPIGAMTVNPAVFDKLPYSPLGDFTPVSMIASFPLVLVVGASSPPHTLAETIAYAKANPKKANIGGSGAGFQLVDALFKMRTGAPLEYVTYKSSTETVTALMGGEIMMAIVDTGPVSGQLKGGQVRGIAVTTAKRIESLPELPTMQEAGLTGMDVEFWSGMFAPAATPPAIVARLEREVIQIVALPDVRERMRALEVTPVGNSSAEFRKRIEKEIEQWTSVARTNNIRIER